MFDDLGFNVDEFIALPVQERVRLCRRLAMRAQRLAELCEPRHRAIYAEIRNQWFDLAGEMERHSPRIEQNATSH